MNLNIMFMKYVVFISNAGFVKGRVLFLCSNFSESACVAPTFGQQFGNAPFGDMMCATLTGTSGEANDPEAGSDCSTTDTTLEALSALVAGDGTPFGSPFGSQNPYMCLFFV